MCGGGGLPLSSRAGLCAVVACCGCNAALPCLYPRPWCRAASGQPCPPLNTSACPACTMCMAVSISVLRDGTRQRPRCGWMCISSSCQQDPQHLATHIRLPSSLVPALVRPKRHCPALPCLPPPPPPPHPPPPTHRPPPPTCSWSRCRCPAPSTCTRHPPRPCQRCCSCRHSARGHTHPGRAAHSCRPAPARTRLALPCRPSCCARPPGTRQASIATSTCSWLRGHERKGGGEGAR